MGQLTPHGGSELTSWAEATATARARIANEDFMVVRMEVGWRWLRLSRRVWVEMVVDVRCRWLRGQVLGGEVGGRGDSDEVYADCVARVTRGWAQGVKRGW